MYGFLTYSCCENFSIAFPTLRRVSFPGSLCQNNGRRRGLSHLSREECRVIIRQMDSSFPLHVALETADRPHVFRSFSPFYLMSLFCAACIALLPMPRVQGELPIWKPCSVFDQTGPLQKNHNENDSVMLPLFRQYCARTCMHAGNTMNLISVTFHMRQPRK